MTTAKLPNLILRFKKKHMVSDFKEMNGGAKQRNITDVRLSPAFRYVSTIKVLIQIESLVPNICKYIALFNTKQCWAEV